MSNTKYIDYLSEDNMITNQQWVCISFLSPEGIKNCSVRGVKIRGSYPTRELANERAKELQETDPDFHVFVGEVGKWLAWDPDVNSVEENVHANEELNKLAHAYKDNLKKKDKLYHQRTKDLQKNGASDSEIDEGSSSTNYNAKDYSSRLDKKKQQMRERFNKRKQELQQKSPAGPVDCTVDSLEEVATKELDVEQKEVVVKEQFSKVNQGEKQIADSKNNISSIDEKLNKIKSIYKNLKK